MTTEKQKRVVFYLRVSTKDQTVETQQRELEAAAEARGWKVVGIYRDEGISGSKGRDKRPGLDKMLKDASRGGFDVVGVWAVDRIGRSLIDLISTLQELAHTKKDLFILKQQIDTTTAGGKAMFGMLGVFAEFERDMIINRVNAGIARAKSKGIHCGRPPMSEDLKQDIAEAIHQGYSSHQIGKMLNVGSTTVLRVRAQLQRQKEAA